LWGQADGFAIYAIILHPVSSENTIANHGTL